MKEKDEGNYTSFDKWSHQSIDLNSSDEEDNSTITSKLYIDENEEKALVRRLDKHLLAFAMFGNLVKALDNSNLGTKKKSQPQRRKLIKRKGDR